MRIIAGTMGGRRLQAPAGSDTRPTSDRVREALFSILGPPPDDTHVLDLFAGAGTLGLEAISRGAVSAVFVDSGRPAVRCLRANIAALAVGDQCTVMQSPVARALGRLARRAPSPRFRWVFLDPPYAGDAASVTLAALAAGSLFTDDATVVVEHDRRNPPDAAFGSLIRTDLRRYGDTELSFYMEQRTP